MAETDAIAGDVDDVRAEIADRARAGLRSVEAPDRFVGVPAPRLEIAGAEMHDVAELARLDQLSRQPHCWDEPVVEPAHVVDARSLRLRPHPMRLVGRQAEGLLADDVLAVARR